MIDIDTVDFIYRVNDSFNIPIYLKNSLDECGDFFETKSISASKGDIIFMSISKEDRDLLIINRHETINGEKEMSYQTSLSSEFLKINPFLFTEIPKKIYNRDSKIDELIA